jgi:hypothetical protein
MLTFAGCGFLLETAASAAEPFTGRWAADAQACGGNGPAMPLLVVDALSLRWRDAACAVRTSYRVRDAWHIGAQCWADGAASDVAIVLRLHGNRLVLDWAGTPREELRRCP